MSIDHARKTIIDVASSGKAITLYPYYLGETLIHPEFLQFLDHVSGFANISVNIVSNAILLNDKMIAELLSRPIKSFHFSLHECDTALQAGCHPKQAISSRNVLKFLKEAHRIGRRNKVWVGVSMTPTTLEDPAIEAFREFFQDVVDAVNIFPYMTRERSTLDASLNEAILKLSLPCAAPFLQPVISVDGSVLPCCWDYGHEMVLGNAFSRPFNRIYADEPATSLKTALLADDLASYPVCRNCDKWVDFLPNFPRVQMGDYYFQSTGANLSFQTALVDEQAIDRKLSTLEIVGDGRHNLPLHRGGRIQARKSN